jgi:hypothetical protein
LFRIDVPAVYFNGEVLHNNSIVNAFNIDDGSVQAITTDTLVCLTNQLPCCSDSDDGSWFDPSGSQLPAEPTSRMFFQMYFPQQSVALYRSPLTPSTSEGVFRCQITDRSNMVQHMYIGIYSRGNGMDPELLECASIRIVLTRCSSGIRCEIR